MDDRSSSSYKLRQIQELVSKHQDHIHRFIRSRSGPEVLKWTTVDDLYQETVATAIASADRFVYQDDRRFMAWICTIAFRQISDTVRQSRRRPPTLRIKGPNSTGIGVGEGQLDAFVKTPSSIVAGRERRVALADAILLLPADYREVLTLYKIEERPLAEVAEKMGRTKGATARLIARALSALRKVFGNQ